MTTSQPSSNTETIYDPPTAELGECTNSPSYKINLDEFSGVAHSTSVKTNWIGGS